MALIIFALTFLLALFGAFGLQQFGEVQNPLLMGLILSTTSLGLVAPTLKCQELIRSEYGQFLLVAASIADFVTLLLLTVVVAAENQGLTSELLFIPALIIIFGVVAAIGYRLSSIKILQQLVHELSHATAQIRVRGAMALMVGWVVLAETLGIELILGAFLAGAIANLVSRSTVEETTEKLDPIGYGFFIPIFFFMVGAELDIGMIFESPEAMLLIPELLILAYLVKMLPALLLKSRFGWRNSIAGGFLLSSRLSLIIAAAAIALEVGAISPVVEADIVIVAVATSTISPLVFNRLYRTEQLDDVRQKIIIVGTDQLTELLARRFTDLSQEVTVLSSSISHYEALEHAPCEVVFSDTFNIDSLEKAGAAKAQAMIILAQNSAQLCMISELASRHFQIPVIVARVAETSMIAPLKSMGIKVVQPALATAMSLENAVRYPTVFNLFNHEIPDVEISEGELHNRSLTDTPLRRLQLPGNALILSIKRNGTILLPQGETLLEQGDHISIIGHPVAVRDTLSVLVSRS
jgi:Kef-type K+ transport system membrane component KefB/Trk K+ transport system NAD-binding subunit